MRSKVQRPLLAVLLSVTLLLTMGMKIDFPQERHTYASVSTEATVPVTTASLPIITAEDTGGAKTAGIANNVESEKTDSVKKVPKPVLMVASVKPALYETTAYFLNVRANGYKTSKILRVLEKGTVVEVLQKTDKGWLQLKGGGYVHSGYAKPVDDNGKKAAPVTVLSAQTGRDQSIPSRQPAVVKKTVARPGKPTSDVQSDSGLTEAHIAAILKGTALSGAGLEKAILEIEDEYGINAYFTIAVMKLESGNGKSKLAKNKNNLFGLNATGGDQYRRAHSFETKGDSVRKFGQLIAEKYVGKGYTTIQKVARKYCPSNPKWPSLVTNIMKRDYNKLRVAV